MPAAIAIPAIATAIGGGAAAAASIYGAKKQGQAAQTAATVQQQANTAAEKRLNDAEAERIREYDQEQATAKTAWDAQEARRAPYRQSGQNALMKLSQMVGLQAPNIAGPQEMPAGFTPGAPGTVPPTPQPGTVTLAELLKQQQPKYLQSGVF